MSALSPLLPQQLDKRFRGKRAALWLLGAYLVLKVIMSVNSILFAERIASTADGIPIATFEPAAANEVLLLFTLVGLGQLALAAIGVIVLFRYRLLVPLMFLLLLAESIARRMIVASYATQLVRAPSAGFLVNIGLIAVLGVGFGLSMWPSSAAGGERK